MTEAQLQLLKTELITDPFALYATELAAGNHTAVAALINTVRAGAVLAWELAVATDALRARVTKAEYIALTAADREYLDFLLRGEVLETSYLPLRTELGDLFGAGTATRAAWLALAQRLPTRAEEVLGMGVTVIPDDVARALLS